jgi:hypothetical protein
MKPVVWSAIRRARSRGVVGVMSWIRLKRCGQGRGHGHEAHRAEEQREPRPVREHDPTRPGRHVDAEEAAQGRLEAGRRVVHLDLPAGIVHFAEKQEGVLLGLAVDAVADLSRFLLGESLPNSIRPVRLRE